MFFRMQDFDFAQIQLNLTHLAQKILLGDTATKFIEQLWYNYLVLYY